jgi:hypothetical protein
MAASNRAQNATSMRIRLTSWSSLIPNLEVITKKGGKSWPTRGCAQLGSLGLPHDQRPVPQREPLTRIIRNRCFERSIEKPRPGETGALRTEGGGGCRGAFHPIKILSLFKLTAALPFAPLHSAAKDHHAPLTARRRDLPPRNAPLQSALVSGHV